MSQKTNVTIGGEECLLPNPTDYALAWEKANSFRCPIGPATGRGHVLITRKTLNKLLPANEPVELMFKAEGDAGAGEVKLKKVYLHSGFRVNFGNTSDDEEAAYLIRLVDKRYFLNRWTTTTRVFNAMNWSGGDQDRYYLRDTIKAIATPYQWEEVIAQLWADCKILGAFTGLGALAVPPPIDLFFVGVNPWRALNELLDKIGRTVAYDPTADRFYVVRLSNPEPSANDPFAVNGKPRPDLLWDGRPFSGGACVAPETIRVHFYVKYEDYGSERDTEAVGNWAAIDHSTFVDFKTGAAGAVKGTVLSIWDDMPALRSHANRAVFQNLEWMKAKAKSRAEAWLKKNAADRFSRHHYIVNGPANIPNDGVIKQVIWRNYGGKEGLCTEVQKFPGLPNDIDFDGSSIAGGSIAKGSSNEAAFIDDFTSENFATPDLMRRTFPNYPRLPNFVTVTIGNSDAECESLGSVGFLKPYEGTAIFGGYVIRYSPEGAAMETLEPCWILAIGERAGADPGPRIRKNDVLYGRLSGKYEAKAGIYAGVRLPLYVVRAEEMLSVLNSCDCGTDPAAATKINGKCKVDHITFDKGVGFELYQPNNNEDGVCVGIKGCQSYTVLNQWNSNQRPVWTRSPIFGGNITTYGAVKFGQQFENGRFRGGGSIRGGGDHITLPRGAKSCCQPVQVKGIYGNCVELEYGKAGPSGYLFASLATSAGGTVGTYKIYIDCGRIVGIGVSGAVAGYAGALSFPSASACPSAPCPPADVPPCSPCVDFTPPDYTPPDLAYTPPYDNGGTEGESTNLPTIPINFTQGPVYGVPGSSTESFILTRRDTVDVPGQVSSFFQAATEVRYAFRPWRPLNRGGYYGRRLDGSEGEMQAWESILVTFSPGIGIYPLGPVDFAEFRNILQAVLLMDIEENPTGSIVPNEPGVFYDPATGLKFKNETPSMAANFNEAEKLMRAQFFSYRVFESWEEVYTVEDRFLPTSEGGTGPTPLELNEFLIFRESLYYWGRQDLEQ